MVIPVMLEPAYAGSWWCAETLCGMREAAATRKYRLLLLDQWSPESNNVPDNNGRHAVVILGTGHWVAGRVEQLTAAGIYAILVSYQLDWQTPLVSSVVSNHYTAMQQLVQTMGNSGHDRMLLYGMNPNSYADRIKCGCFRQLCGKLPPIIYNEGSLAHCWQLLQPWLDDCNGIICANDPVALSLLSRLRAAGVAVPQRVGVSGFGGTLLAEISLQRVTTASFNHQELGRQAVGLFNYMVRQPRWVSTTIRVDSSLIVGETTKPPTAATFPVCSADSPSESHVNFYEDREATSLIALEELLATSDSLDLDILVCLLQGRSTEETAFEVNSTESTVRYRLKKLSAICGVAGREYLLALVKQHLSVEALTRCARSKQVEGL